MPGNASTNIDNIFPHQNIYQGAQGGYVLVYRRGDGSTIGPDVFRSHTHNYTNIGPAGTLALCLTERCAHLKRGKVYFYIKDFYTKSSLTRGTYPDAYIQLPELFYVDFKWTDEDRDEWFRSPHWQRLELLSARSNVLHTAIPCMPITLCYESEDYANIQIYEGVGRATLYYNSHGSMYLGFFADLTRLAGTGTVGRNNRTFWLASKTNIGHFQMREGRQAAEELRRMYTSGRAEGLFLYGEIVQRSIEAHRAWVANGGYTIESDPNLGYKIINGVARVLEERGEEAGPDPIVVPVEVGERLAELREESNTWPDYMKTALEQYTNAANEGVHAVTIFMIRDDNWRALSIDEQEKIAEIYRLEDEATERQPSLAPMAAAGLFPGGRGRGFGRGHARGRGRGWGGH